jgi:hypothetical protein
MARLLDKTIVHLGLKNITQLRDIVSGNENGLKIMRDILQEKKEKYYLATGQELEITEAEFFDMVRKEITSMSKELIMLSSVLSLFFASKLAAPDKDDDELAKARYKWYRKLFNKISNELDFYYNPMSADSITRGSIIPSLSILNKVQKAFISLGKEVYGEVADDQEIQDKAYPLKNFLNLIPGPAQFQNEILTYLWPETAKEMGIKFNEQARIGQ